MKKLGFTLAEVLITLMILGVIAAMTVPSLIQDTQGKEQVVLMKKGHSMLNQAVTMNYALEQEDFGNCYEETATDEDGNTIAAEACVLEMLKKRLSTIDSSDTNYWVKTQDGLTYYFTQGEANKCKFNEDIGNDGEGDGKCFDFIISTSPTAVDAAYATVAEKLPTAEEANTVLTGYYQFYAGRNRVIAAYSSQKIMNTPKVATVTKEDLTEEE